MEVSRYIGLAAMNWLSKIEKENLFKKGQFKITCNYWLKYDNQKKNYLFFIIVTICYFGNKYILASYVN
jgi:hypothetical protein